MTTITINFPTNRSRGIDRLAASIGVALLLWSRARVTESGCDAIDANTHAEMRSIDHGIQSREHFAQKLLIQR